MDSSLNPKKAYFDNIDLADPNLTSSERTHLKNAKELIVIYETLLNTMTSGAEYLSTKVRRLEFVERSIGHFGENVMVQHIQQLEKEAEDKFSIVDPRSSSVNIAKEKDKKIEKLNHEMKNMKKELEHAKLMSRTYRDQLIHGSIEPTVDDQLAELRRKLCTVETRGYGKKEAAKQVESIKYEIENLQNKFKSLDGDGVIERWNHRYEAAIEKIEDRDEEIQNLRTKIQNLELRIRSQRHDTTNEEIRKLSEENKRLKMQIKDITTQLSTLQMEKLRFEMKTEEQLKEIAQLKIQISKADTANKTQQDLLSLSRKQLLDEQVKLKDANIAIIERDRQLEVLRDHWSKETSEKKKLEAEVEELKKKIRHFIVHFFILEITKKAALETPRVVDETIPEASYSNQDSGAEDVGQESEDGFWRNKSYEEIKAKWGSKQCLHNPEECQVNKFSKMSKKAAENEEEFVEVNKRKAAKPCEAIPLYQEPRKSKNRNRRCKKSRSSTSTESVDEGDQMSLQVEDVAPEDVAPEDIGYSGEEEEEDETVPVSNFLLSSLFWFLVIISLGIIFLLV